MERKLNINLIWWRNVKPGEFYNIERHHQIAGGGGSLYIEIPSSMVPATCIFLDIARDTIESQGEFMIQAGVIGQPNLSGPITFKPKSGGRLRIARQNRQQPNSQRHPAWSPSRGFPTAPDNVPSNDSAKQYFPNGGLRIYIAKTVEGHYYAGFNKGPRPANMQQTDPAWNLYSEKGVGGLIYA
jgi:hypothetical protein